MFHKEGFQIILITFLLVTAISIGAEYAFTNLYIQKGTQVVAIGILVLVLQFLEIPKDIPLLMTPCFTLLSMAK